MSVKSGYDKQPEIVELMKQLARKYGVSLTQVNEVIDLKFEIVREQLKKSNIIKEECIAVRMHKLGIFYIPKIVQRRINKNLNLDNNEQSK